MDEVECLESLDWMHNNQPVGCVQSTKPNLLVLLSFSLFFAPPFLTKRSIRQTASHFPFSSYGGSEGIKKKTEN